jgi:glycosyltransferase 2 family protein
MKFAFFILVSIGLAMATHRAVKQWQSTTASVEAEVSRIQSRLDESIAQNRDPADIETLRSELSDARSRVPSLVNFDWNRLMLAGCLYGLGLLPPGWLLGSIVRALGANVRQSTAMAAQILGHTGKYIPGKVAVVMIRAGIMADDKVPILISTIAVFVETFLMMAVGGAISAAVLAFLPLPSWLIAAGLIMAVCAGVPTLPPILRRITARLTKADPNVLNHGLTWKVVLRAWALSTLSWLLIGGSFALILTAVPTTSQLRSFESLYPIATAAISLSMAVGFVSLLPGGVGVRELVLMSVLSVVTDFSHGMFAALTARFLFIAVESLLAGIFWLRRRISTSTELT